MATRPDENVWLIEEQEFSVGELAQLSGLSEPEVRELVDYGAIAPVRHDAPQWIFKGDCLVTVRAAGRLRASFELEPHALALVIALLDRVRGLEAELGGMRARMPR